MTLSVFQDQRWLRSRHQPVIAFWEQNLCPSLSPLSSTIVLSIWNDTWSAVRCSTVNTPGDGEEFSCHSVSACIYNSLVIVRPLALFLLHLNIKHM